MSRPWLYALIGIVVLFVAAVLVVAYFASTFLKLTTVPPLQLDAARSPGPQIEAWVDGLHASERFNGALSVRDKGDVIVRRAWGSWDETGERALGVDTPLRLASLSKPFTATAVLTLVRDGAVTLDGPLSDYLPECAWPGVTVRHLLSHSSAIPDDYMSMDASETVTVARVVADVCGRAEALQSAPGETYSYSNTGYVLLAGLVERVSGESFEAYLKRAVLDPLGMTNSRVWNLVSRPGGLEVAPTFVQWERPPVAEVPTHLDGVAGDGAVHASLSDVERFIAAWADGSVLPPELHREALTRQAGAYGLGWVIQDDGWIFHNGAWLGARTTASFHRDTGDWRIIIDNGSSLATDAMSLTLKSALAELPR